MVMCFEIYGIMLFSSRSAKYELGFSIITPKLHVAHCAYHLELTGSFSLASDYYAPAHLIFCSFSFSEN